MAAIQSAYDLTMHDALGRHKFDISFQGQEGLKFEYKKIVNGVGKFTLTYPTTLTGGAVARDNQVQFWRSPFGDSGKFLDFLGFVRYSERKTDSKGREVTIVKGHDPNGLLDRRIVAYRQETDQATATGIAADDAMKDIINENFASGATDTARDLSAEAGLTFLIDADLGAGPTLEKSFAWRRVLDVLQEISEFSYTAGTEVFFDLQAASVNVTSGAITYRFRTFTGQPGIDRAYAGGRRRFTTISARENNLIREFYVDDARKERNYVYALGPQEGENRDLEERSDATRIGASVFNRQEGYVDASNVDPDNETAEVQAIGDEELARLRPKIRAGGTILQTDFFRYGRHWRHGDLVTIDVFETQYDGIIRLTEYKLADGEEDIRGLVLNTGT